MSFLDDILNSFIADYTGEFLEQKPFFEEKTSRQYPEDWNKGNNPQSMDYKYKYPEDENKDIF
jgi:hypothetical protein